MKAILLAGGYGTRISEETQSRPKPMVEIGGKPILCHILGIYAHYGYNDFVVACGYKGDCIKAFFNNLRLHDEDTGEAPWDPANLDSDPDDSHALEPELAV